MQEEHEKAVRAVSFRVSSLLLLAGKKSLLQLGAGTWAVPHGQAGKVLLLLPQRLQRRAVKLRLSREARVQASASFVDTLYI